MVLQARPTEGGAGVNGPAAAVSCPVSRVAADSRPA